MSNFLKLRLMPVIIDGPGEYLTRCGEVATIDKMLPNRLTFPCVGNYSTGEREHWSPSGRVHGHVECKNDIISKK